MKKTLLTAMAALCAAGMLASCNNNEAKVRQIPLEDFFRNPEVTSYQISPGGDYYSYMAPWESRRNIFVQKVGETEAVRLTSETERDIAGYAWISNDRLIYLKDVGGDENYQLFGVTRDGGEVKEYTPFPGVRTQIIDVLDDQDDYMLIGLNKRNPMIFDPYRLNLVTGEMEMIAENPGNIQGWGTDNDGKLRVAVAIVDGVNTQVLYRETESQPFRPVITTNYKETVGYSLFTPDNKEVYAISNLGRDKLALVRMDPATATELEVLYTNDKYDISNVSANRVTKELEAVSYVGHKDRVRHYFNEDFKNKVTKLESKLPGYSVGISSTDKLEEVWIVTASNDRQRPTYYVYDTRTDELTKIAESAPWIKAEEMAEMRPVTYQSRDGLTIEAYLTLPVGYTMENAKNLPVVVNPHGGPWARDYWGFNPEIQFLANRGYAVFQMNFRGSTGFGRKFTEISYGEWGLTMQDDIIDGTQWLIDKGIADPDRIAIYGASYGGYATLMGIVKSPELYAAAVDYVGVSNLFTFMETIPPYWKPLLDMLHEQVGDPVKDSVRLRETSPVFQVDKIVTPLFVAQGANDPRVNIAESDQIVEALRARGVDVEYMVKDNEGHGFSNEENRFDFYRAMEKFLNDHMGKK